MENWNPIGWVLLVGGFLIGVIIGAFGAWGTFWLVSYGVMLAGLTILVTNMVRSLWRAVRNRRLINSRLFS